MILLQNKSERICLLTVNQ